MLPQLNSNKDVVRRSLAGAEAPKIAKLWPAPDMSVLKQGRREVPIFPIGILGPVWSRLASDAAEASSAPVDYVACSVLTVAAALIGNSRWVSPWAGWCEPTIVWCGIVGDPSSNKSPALDFVLTATRSLEAEMAHDFDPVFRQWEEDAVVAQATRDQWERDVKDAVKGGSQRPPMPEGAAIPAEPVRPRIIVSDTTPEKLGELLAAHHRGLMFHRDELFGWFSSFDRYTSGGERTLWLEAYGGRKYVIDRKSTKAPIVVSAMTISILGGVQPDRLAEMIEGADDGLPARFLWTWPEAVPPRRPNRAPDTATALQLLRTLLRLEMASDEHGEPTPQVVPLTEEAAKLFQEWRDEHHAAAQSLAGPISSAFGKMAGQLLRLASVLEHLWWSGSHGAGEPQSISRSAVECAAALVTDYFGPMASRVYGDAALPKQDRAAATLARWIVRGRAQLINARDIRRKARLPGLRDADEVAAALAVLVEADWIEAKPTREGGSAGRQRADYVVNPNVQEMTHG